MSNPQAKVLPIEQFYGGQSTDKVLGPKASFSYSRALDFRRNPSQLTVLPGMRKISSTVVTDLPLNIVQVTNGDRYACGDTGKTYKIDSTNTVTAITNTISSGTDGLLYRSDSDALYQASHTKLHRYYPISGTPTWDQTYGESKSTDSNAYRTGGSNTYTLKTSVSETATDLFSFQPDIEPLYSVKVKVVAKGTGDWTLTLHDGVNTALGSVTVANASLTNGSLVEFKFASQIRAYVKPNARTYHVHLTSTTADGTVQVATASDLSGADFELWAYRFVDTVNGLHPMAQFLQYTLIGNGNYLAVWEPLSPSNPPNNEFLRHRLTFPSGFEVCGIASNDVYAAIACERRSSNGSRDFQQGAIFLWDGFSQTYNQIINVPGGSPEALTTFNNYFYFISNGLLTAYLGGVNTTTILALPNSSSNYSDTRDNTRIFPNMMAIRDGLLHFGFPSYTTNTAVEFGIYTWGTMNKDYPNSFGYSYVPSTMTSDPTDPTGIRKIGCVRNFGDEMYLGWKDGSNYGIDIVDSQSDPAPVFKFRSRVFNGGVTAKTKMALRFAVDTQALPSGITLTPVHQVNDSAEVPHDSLTSGGTRALAPVTNGRFNRFIFGFDGISTASTSPIIYDLALEWDALGTERTL